ncbi:hypothetical protein KWG61_00925 [Allobaculum sp. Allo2]|nr:hypothetical protein [Allobaculum sp. Allo2]UNT93428.1 hypothetical protein KWG61_00925 [Allobaculum sp. Allo2]
MDLFCPLERKGDEAIGFEEFFLKGNFFHAVPGDVFLLPAETVQSLVFIVAGRKMMCTAFCIRVVDAIKRCRRSGSGIESDAFIVPAQFDQPFFFLNIRCVVMISGIWIIQSVDRVRTFFRGKPV